MEDALSSSHHSLVHFSIRLGGILQQFGIFNISINLLCILPYSSFDLSPIFAMALVIYPHFHHIVSLLIHLNTLLHDISSMIQSTIHHLSFSHATSTLLPHSSWENALPPLNLSICHMLNQIKGHITTVLSLSLPDISESGIPKDMYLCVGLQLDSFCSALLDLQDDFNNFAQSVQKLLPLSQQLVDSCMYVIACSTLFNWGYPRDSMEIDGCIMYHNPQVTFNPDYLDNYQEMTLCGKHSSDLP